MQKPEIYVWFSCGAASAVALKKTIENYSHTHKIRAINNPVANEHHDNQRFLRDVEKWCGIKIEYATNPKYPSNDCNDVWKRGYMSGVAGAPCTGELKKKARQIYEKENGLPDYMVLGFTLDEKKRHERFVKTERANVLPILIEEGITKQDCYKILIKAGIELPEIYKYGFPNANCIGCVKATSPTYWNLVREKFPEVFEERAKLSRKIGCRLVRVKGERKFLDELKPNENGRKLASADIDKLKDEMKDIECGIFCEEK